MALVSGYRPQSHFYNMPYHPLISYDLMSQHNSFFFTPRSDYKHATLNTQTLLGLPCLPGNEFTSCCIMRVGMGSIWLQQGWVGAEIGRQEGGNARFNEM